MVFLNFAQQDQRKMCGLSSEEAHVRLKSAIEDELGRHVNKQKGSLVFLFKDVLKAFYHNHDIPVNWFGLCLLLLQSGALLAAYILGDKYRYVTKLSNLRG